MKTRGKTYSIIYSSLLSTTNWALRLRTSRVRRLSASLIWERVREYGRWTLAMSIHGPTSVCLKEAACL